MYAERTFTDWNAVGQAASIVARTCDRVEYSIDDSTELVLGPGEVASIPYKLCAWASFVAGGQVVASLANDEGLRVYEPGAWDLELDAVEPQQRDWWSWINVDIESDRGTDLSSEEIAQSFIEYLHGAYSADFLSEYLKPLNVDHIHVAAIKDAPLGAKMSRTGGMLLVEKGFDPPSLGAQYLKEWWHQLIREVGVKYLRATPYVPWQEGDVARVTVEDSTGRVMADESFEAILQVLDRRDVELDGWEMSGNSGVIPVGGKGAKGAIESLVQEASRLHINVVDVWPWRSMS